MSVLSPERIDPEVEAMTFTNAEFDIVCDIASLSLEDPRFPKCKGDPARWVGWRSNCCPNSPRYRLLCNACKKVYQAWAARDAHVTCGICGQESEFVAFTPLEGKS